MDEFIELINRSKTIPDHLNTLLEEFETLNRQQDWSALFQATHQATNGPDTGTIWDEIQYYRGRAAEQIGEWEIGAFSWLWCSQQDGITMEESVQRLNRGIICYIRLGEMDKAEKTLFDEICEYPEGDFSPVFEEFRLINFKPCFYKPEAEQLTLLIDIPQGREGELEAAHEWSKTLQHLPPHCLSDVIHRISSWEFMVLYELCRNPEMEKVIATVMSGRAEKYIQRDRVYYRCKCDQPCFTLKEALWVKRKVERLARVSFAMQQIDEHVLDAEFYSTIPRLVP